jgi:hypothetical protein
VLSNLVIGNTSQLSHYFPNDYEKISYDEIYLFGYTYKNINLLKMYNMLTNDEKETLNPEMFRQFCLNIGLKKINNTPKTYQEFYDAISISKNKLYKVAVPIGMEFIKEGKGRKGGRSIF